MINKFYTKTGGDAYSHFGAIQQLPEITVAERDALTPQEGWIARVETFGLQYYNGTGWVTFPVGIIDTLVSTSVIDALSANQGKVLQDGKEPADATILKQANVVDTLVSTSVIAPLSANQGKQLEDTKQANLVSGTNIKTINGNSVLGSGDLEVGGGKVLQVVHASTTTEVIITALNTYTDTTLSATITPLSVTSKIYIRINHQLVISSTGLSFNGGVRVLRGATAIFTPGGDSLGPIEIGASTSGTSGASNLRFRHCIDIEDSPATTSPVTYKTQGNLRAGTGLEFQSNFASGTGTSTITLIEVE